MDDRRDNRGNGNDTLVSAIEKAGLKAFSPTGDQASRAEGQQEFSALTSRTGTFALISTLNALMKPDGVPAWLRVHLMDLLTLLPLRPDGVRATLEFVFSVHPSSTVRTAEAAEPHKQGANITMEALKLASNLLSVPPAAVGPEKWFPGIAPQLLALLDGKDGKDLTKAAAYIIGFGVLGRKQLGAPGTPGWKAFAEPILAQIDPVLSSQTPEKEAVVFSAGPDEVVDLRRDTVLVQPDALHTALKRLSSLLDSHPNPGLTKRLLAPLMLSLWSLSSWPSTNKDFDERYRRPAKILLEIYLKLAGSTEKFQRLLSNLLFKGNTNSPRIQWVYDMVGEADLQIKLLREDASNSTIQELNWQLLESKADAFVGLLRSVGSDSDVSTLFLELLQGSLKPLEPVGGIKIKLENDEPKDPTAQLVQAKVLQKMMDALSDRLIANWKQMLELVGQILGDFQTSSASDDATGVALSLLNLVVTAPGFQKSNVRSDLLSSIEGSLERISKAQVSDLAQTARNLSLLLKYRDAVEDPSERPSAPTDRQVEDRKTYSLAISYITQPDSPPPVRSEGLNLLSSLIQANSPILDIQATLVLLSSLLNDDDDYINLTVIRLFTQVANRHPRSTTKEILEHYVDANEQEKTDTRLRFGEALLQVIQRLGETFTGETATQVGEALLSIAGRRAQRPKTEARQRREERLRQQKQKREAGEARPPEEPPSSSEEEGEADQEVRALLAQIVSGWESRRGAEDIRMRASALSILSTAVETHAAGLGPRLVEGAVDVSLAALTHERGPETGILRRAAVVLVLAFVRALAAAREGRHRRLGFGLPDPTRDHVAAVLGYVAQTDADGLVRQHARDALESLENWRLTELLPEVGDEGGPAVARLRGLDVGEGPRLPRLETGAARPRIEEVE
ncbi:hypothetical protein F4779DRAFT_620082 [Xylariaceae sp. FL0662B]|nr:hypothetical protein F4779DRAFT_620082 [Xylariaceae sp. FL0662B]